MKKLLFGALLIGMLLIKTEAQQFTYNVELVPIDVPQLGGLQSYAFGTHGDEWLIIGGRLDGLHRRQPFASFDEAGNNQHLMVLNPTTLQTWKYPISNLPAKLREQFSSTNMQFYQDGEELLLTGGYAYSPSEGDHITYPYLTIINVPNIIEQIKIAAVDVNEIVQIEHESFRVTGGRMGKIEDVYYLVGGHKFMGRYNPMGPNHGPGFDQEYTDEVRKFKLDKSSSYQVDFLSPIHDERHLHRRDYNLVPVIQNEEYGLMAYSGVFKPSVDLPWLYPVRISSNDIHPEESFIQHFNHYHCATLPIYSPSSKEMSTLFFGGIAQFYLDNETLVQDNDVPFVKTIANVFMDDEGNLKERVLDQQMPDYLGAGSEFIYAPTALLYEDGILNGDNIGNEAVHVGYIYGGIRSSMPNIFWINTGVESVATNTIFKVMVNKSAVTKSKDISLEEETLLIFPNPAQDYVRMAVNLEKQQDVEVSIYDSIGQHIHSYAFSKSELNSGMNYLNLDKVKIDYGAYLYKIKIGDEIMTRRVIWTE